MRGNLNKGQIEVLLKESAVITGVHEAKRSTVYTYMRQNLAGKWGGCKILADDRCEDHFKLHPQPT
jgi:hypothetical protein